QLAWKYGHVRQAKTGLLDAFFEAYFPYEDQGMAFYDWVDNVYDPDEVTRAFQAKGWA
ncbi:MAG TPA: protein tyrosine phosphatase, partial [Alphaproteobacteria bacterium]|nr:protein tyrosine phosphatase [Alphaproteobacteria bacterium]